jgi:hypothetical protein
MKISSIGLIVLIGTTLVKIIDNKFEYDVTLIISSEVTFK